MDTINLKKYKELSNNMVTIYSQPGCNPCRMTKKALNRAGVDYKDVDVTTDEAALTYIKNLGYQAVPVIEANGEHWFGYNPEKLASLK